MFMTAGQRDRLQSALPYFLLLLPSLLAALAHIYYVPHLGHAYANILEGVSLPKATQLALDSGPMMIVLAIFFVLLAFASTRFSALRGPVVPTLLGSVLATLYLAYGLALTLPAITIGAYLGDAASAGIANPSGRAP